LGCFFVFAGGVILVLGPRNVFLGGRPWGFFGLWMGVFAHLEHDARLEQLSMVFFFFGVRFGCFFFFGLYSFFFFVFAASSFFFFTGIFFRGFP